MPHLSIIDMESSGPNRPPGWLTAIVAWYAWAIIAIILLFPAYHRFAPQVFRHVPWIRRLNVVGDSESGRQDAPQANTPFVRDLQAIYLVLPSITFALCVLFWLIRQRMGRAVARVRRLSFVIFPYIALALATAAIARSTTLAATDPFARIKQWEVWAWLVVCSVVLLLQAVLLSAGDIEAEGGEGSEKL